MTYEISLSGIQTAREMHECIKASLHLPEPYGMNLDALWDCLTGFVETPCAIRLTGLENASPSLRPRVDALIKVLHDACEYHASHGREMHLLLPD